MAPSAKVQAAFRAMKELGIPEKKTKPVLKKLLQLYERNWKLIEEESYRVLADAIFDAETEEATQYKSIPDNPDACPVNPVGNVLEQEPQAQDEPERPLKRLRRGGPTSNAGPSIPADGGSALKQPKPEPVDEPQARSTPDGSEIVPQKNKGKQPLSSLPSQSEPLKSPGGRSHMKELTKESCTVPTSKGKEPAANGLIIPKDEPSTDGMPLDEVPLDVIRPESLPEAAPSTANGSSHSHTQDHLQSGCTDGTNACMTLPSSADEEQNNLALTVVPDKSLVDEIATSSLGEKEPNGVLDKNLQSLVVFEQQQLNSDDMKCIRDSDDITRGEERVKISLVNESQRELIPSFHYIPQSVVYQNANVNFFFSQIGDEDYCHTCYGNCLSSSTETACLCAKGGGFVYTSEGLLKEEFLEECMSMVRNPQKLDIVQCSTCPLEKCKNDGMLEPCKGHFKRKFIKECWVKCGCSKICANRVVQRGITCKLQIFWTPEGKGWGLRTLEELPKGAFICEFVGEVLTISELQQRSLKRKGNEKHSYAAVLDSGWAYGDVQDNQSLCLDGTFYGNVARFINHRCLDANLVEVPVQVEASDQHYYHMALFTTRKVDAMEELTWDYGIDFEDEDHHLKAFLCSCGSNFCRNMKRASSKHTGSRTLSNVHRRLQKPFADCS